jgi:hypothetical protein
MFVFCIQPVDHRLSNIVLGSRTDKDGKARIWTDEIILPLKKWCLDRGFKAVAVSADGDPHYRRFADPMQNRADLPILNEAPFMEIVHNLLSDDLFLTDFLHTMKCLRHRLATSLLALCPQVTHDVTTLAQLKSVINVDCALTTKQRASQLRDSFALNVFTLENRMKLLNANQVNLGLSFIPIVLWRVATQAVNITSGGRIRLVGMAFDVVRRCYSLDHAGNR